MYQKDIQSNWADVQLEWSVVFWHQEFPKAKQNWRQLANIPTVYIPRCKFKSSGMREDCKQILCIIKTMECFLFVRCHIMSQGLSSIPICNMRFNTTADFVNVQWHTRPSFPNMIKILFLIVLLYSLPVFVFQLSILHVCSFITTGNVECKFGKNWVDSKTHSRLLPCYWKHLSNWSMIDSPLKLYSYL